MTTTTHAPLIMRMTTGSVDLVLPENPGLRPPEIWDHPVVHELIYGAHMTVRWDRGMCSLLVARKNLERATTVVLNHYGRLELITWHYLIEICGHQCYSSRGGAWACTCGGCCGRNHGAGRPAYGWRLESLPGDKIERDDEEGYLIRTRTLTVEAAVASPVGSVHR
jgi:hypothetical protein